MKKLLIIIAPCILLLAAMPTYTDYSPQASSYLAMLGESIAMEFELIKGYSRDAKYGWNLDIDSGVAETIWPQGGLFQETSGAEPVVLTSDDADDTAAGTGAQTVRVYCIDEDWNEVLETVTMNGTTGATTTTSCRYVNRLAVLSSGSSNGNEGIITASQQTSGIDLITIPASIGISQSCVYVVPNNVEAIIPQVSFSVIRPSSSGRARVIFEGYIKSGNTGSEYRPFRKAIDTDSDSNITITEPYTNIRNPRSIVWWNATTDLNNTEVTCRMIVVERQLE